MGIVFAVLAILAVSIKVLNLFDRNPAVVSQAAGSALSPEIPSLAGEITGQQVAAIGLALALSEQNLSPTAGPRVEPQPGPSAGSWLQSGRLRSLGNTPGAAGRRGK
jgi:Na+-transporting methylmalonyl-CoA/oxaloacetate decarboxylase gamma subunit